ncbi:MAG: hypothetical protein ACI85I_000401 [Arenicella sp.]|jgi:uncharacterized protein (TIGR00255 family)
MIKSMTGFGASRIETDKMTLGIEIKTLNSKFLDTIARLPSVFSSKEIEVKKMLSEKLTRGKIVMSFSYASNQSVSELKVNKEVVMKNYQILKGTADALSANDADIFRLVMTMPDAYTQSSDEDALGEIWKEVRQVIAQAIDACDEFRIQEGQALSKEFEGYIFQIGSLLEKTAARDPERLAHIRQKLHKQVEDFVNHESFDANRFEQELVYYIEKLDISEEKVRLKHHLEYFIETLHSADSNGKKLGFIAQEIGREINTIGSKANDGEIQKLVVEMKEELEKIKEQVLNIV